MAHSIFVGLEGIATATDAWFRKYKNLSDALTAAGFPKTADTGQVDWGTVTVPATATYTAYEIRRFNDTEQATYPIFIKIGYGYVTVTNQYPRLQIQFGTGSDGAGNLTGPIGSTYFSMLSGSLTLRDWLLGADASGFALLSGTTSTIARHFLGIERARDVNGSTVPRYAFFYSSAPTSTSAGPSYNFPTLMVLDFDENIVMSSDTLPVPYWRDLSATTYSLARGMLYPFGVMQFPVPEGMIRNKLMIGCAYKDFADEAILEVPRFSSNTVYRYRLELKEGAGLGGDFGPSPSGVATTTSDTPSAFAMPCIFWD